MVDPFRATGSRNHHSGQRPRLSTNFATRRQLTNAASVNVRAVDGYSDDVADEKDSGSGSIRHPSWNRPVVATVALELAGLAVSGLVALVGWPFGWLPDTSLVGLVTGLMAIGPAAELYRGASPPRRLAVVAALLALVAVRLLVTATVNWAFPALADPGVGILVGYLVALPVGVAVLARFLTRANVA
ncbi:hypothetical protein [Streptomyces chartreusis]|uniref:hypothetical protein n=1 Tax=Streptomyces chartreusis TaxID=1969 RepID=UPI0019C39485|nr:hypothetical protein [Streptomyces chartreusis]GGX20582.1 hypothetical protein GCM10010321_38690 [Streptomyces chartreusis]